MKKIDKLLASFNKFYKSVQQESQRELAAKFGQLQLKDFAAGQMPPS